MDNQLTVALIIISILGFFAILAINLFFVYIPVNRIKKGFDLGVQSAKRTEDKIDGAVTRAEKIEDKIDNIIKEGEKFATEAVETFEEFKKDICDWLGGLGISTPAFCNNSNI